MQYLWNAYKLENDGTNTYDWYVIDSQVTMISAVSAGYPAIGKLCFVSKNGLVTCHNYGEAQAVGSSIRLDISSSQNLAEAFDGAPEPDTTQGATTVSISVGVTAGGADGATVTDSYSISYSLPDVVVTRYFNPQNLGAGLASYVLWSNTAAFNSPSAGSSWTVRSISLIQVKQGYGLQGTLTFGGVAETACTDFLCWSTVQYTWSSPALAINLQSSAPQASFSMTYSGPLLAGQPITFDGTSSSDSDSDPIVSYTWYFSDGSVSGGPSVVSHAFGSAGLQWAKLVVSDGYYSGSVQQSLTVYAASVSGYVVDSSTGAAVVGATVTVKDSAGTTQTTTTNAAGYYLVALAASGATTITASAKDYVTQTLTYTLSVGQALSQTFRLTPVPPDFVLSNCGGWSTFTLSSGYCSVTATSVGKWTGTISLVAVLSPTITGGAYISAGSTASITLTADGSGTFTVSFQTGSTATTYTVTVTGTSGSLTHTTSFNIWVSNPPPPPTCPPTCKT